MRRVCCHKTNKPCHEHKKKKKERILIFKKLAESCKIDKIDEIVQEMSERETPYLTAKDMDDFVETRLEKTKSQETSEYHSLEQKGLPEVDTTPIVNKFITPFLSSDCGIRIEQRKRKDANWKATVTSLRELIGVMKRARLEADASTAKTDDATESTGAVYAFQFSFSSHRRVSLLCVKDFEQVQTQTLRLQTHPGQVRKSRRRSCCRTLCLFTLSLTLSMSQRVCVCVCLVSFNLTNTHTIS